MRDLIRSASEDGDILVNGLTAEWACGGDRTALVATLSEAGCGDHRQVVERKVVTRLVAVWESTTGLAALVV